jgi:hypothetical protein
MRFRFDITEGAINRKTRSLQEKNIEHFSHGRRLALEYCLRRPACQIGRERNRQERGTPTQLRYTHSHGQSTSTTIRFFAVFSGDDWGIRAYSSPVLRRNGLPRSTPTRDLPAYGKRLTWEGIGRYYGILALRYRSNALSPGYYQACRWLAGGCGILAGLGEREAAGLEQALPGALSIVLFHWKQRRTRILLASASTAVSYTTLMGHTPGLLRGATEATPAARQTVEDSKAEGASANASTAMAYVARRRSP